MSLNIFMKRMLRGNYAWNSAWPSLSFAEYVNLKRYGKQVSPIRQITKHLSAIVNWISVGFDIDDPSESAVHRNNGHDGGDVR